MKMKNKTYSRKHEDFLTSFSFTSVEEADFEREETESVESAEELLCRCASASRRRPQTFTLALRGTRVLPVGAQPV